MSTIEKAGSHTETFAAYSEHTEDFPIVVTDHGQPIAWLPPVPNADLETVLLSTDPQFPSLIARSRARQEKEGGISSEEMRRRLGAEVPGSEL